ncbi:MAG: hypothetical protein JWM11_5908 [Planctomycetaceae bacterium]|nr:hypothetical protein [Planctomycetaceae bacterium]
MAKQKGSQIGQADLIEYLNTSSDFAFELRCLELMTGLGFRCRHGGSYSDPVTKKTRQFDLRAQKSDGKLRVRCAIECKSLTDTFPLLVMRVPRKSEESFHELILSYHPDMVEQSFPRIPALEKRCQTVRIDPPHSIYAVDAFVGKSSVQVGRTRENSIIANDAEVFDKWSQALSSAVDLANEAAEEGEEQNDSCLSLILPVLVVPDGTLWQTDFQSNGARSGDPVQTNRCSFFVDQGIFAGDHLQGTNLTVSHLEITTLSGLESLMKDVFVPNNSWFPLQELSGGANENS